MDFYIYLREILKFLLKEKYWLGVLFVSFFFNKINSKFCIVNRFCGVFKFYLKGSVEFWDFFVCFWLKID